MALSLASFSTAVEAYRDRRILFVLLLGFSSGLPIVLIGATLSAWLREADVTRSAIGLFGYVFMPYTLKFVWAPLMDRAPLPLLTAWLGRRRSWLLVSQIGLVVAIWGLGQGDPKADLWGTATWALAVAFFSASQDIVVDAYRVEILPRERLGSGSAVAVIGYRIAMWVAGAGALLLADGYGWSLTYSVMAALVTIGIVTVLLIPEPPGSTTELPRGEADLAARFKAAVVEPFIDFFKRQGISIALVILAFISLYKACDVLLTLMANPFYLDVGFSKTDIAQISGTFGIFATLAGGVIGGVAVYRLGILRALIIGGLLQAGSNLMFVLLAVTGPDKWVFMATVAVENISGGIGTSAFVAYLSSLCSIHYTAVQYALLTSFMQMLGKYIIVPASGFYADSVGWIVFFASSALFALPGLALVFFLERHARSKAPALAMDAAPAALR